MAELTPMMRQYMDVKEQNPDSLLFFRLGDFYEMFGADARTASQELDLALTTRDKDKTKAPEDKIPMCGIPYHSADAYIARLIAKGYKVSICEQTEDPALAKGLVQREVIRTVTPGTVLDDACLDAGRSNYLCGVYLSDTAAGLCACDVSTGKAQATVTRAKHSQATPARPWRPGRDKFLPVSRADMDARGWDQCDFVYICGDAYVDHPSFGMAIISRVLDAHGYKVGIICQPDWTDPASISVLGEPRLGFLVSAGNMDSMVNHYSVTKHRRHTDAYTPGGEEGHRPNRAVTVYGNLIRQTFKDAPIIIGGIEASLRRLAHYDYWQDKLKRSVLLDSGADILIYGMGEHAIIEIADALDAGLPVDQITYINGTVYRTGSLDEVYDYDLLPSWDDLTADKLNYARSFNVQQQNMDPITGHRLVEPYPNSVYVVQNPPSATLSTDEMDEVAELPYARDWHPDYDAAGGVPAFAEIKFSISSNRGCFGECSFCALTFHQGRVLQMRSHDSIMREAELLTRDPEFKGYINDVGGPTANFSRPACDKQLKHGVCKNKRCLWPSVCKNMVVDESG